MSPYDLKRASGLEVDNPFWNIFVPFAVWTAVMVATGVLLYSYTRYSSLPVH